ncbi:ATP/GTP-binding protein [uncultured Thiodictyon sp.]|jgi:predicted ATPase|uniref:AAA family ATPase n=1 Tax=uncultured Thiodictyon sp. TaxID=1846217 RepID=UPI0025CCB11C|nr:ATP-binding protein [uncultured Thiodictyon sp.]
MLIELRVENHRSIRDEQALTMQAADDGDLTDPRPRQVPGFAGRLLPAAALYGANASGKSNVLSALGFMRDAVLRSFGAWPPEDAVPRDPFAWGVKSEEPSLFEVTVLVKGVRYQYGFVANDDYFIEEWLYAWPNSRKQVWFERDGDRFKFGKRLDGENLLVAGITRPNALFLSAVLRVRHQQLAPLYGWFRDLRMVNVGRVGHATPLDMESEHRMRQTQQAWHTRMTQRSLRSEEGAIDQRLASFVDLLRAADVGIVDLTIKDEGPAFLNSDGLGERRLRALLRHHSDTQEDAWLRLEQESQGTRTLYWIGHVLLDVIENGGLLLVDEMDASLHPVLALKIVTQFNDPKINRHNAQILFTTHDTHLLGTMLGEPPLRRDQVWLTEKDPDGATCLYPLTDYKPQPDENVERGYLQGRYGAIPFLGDLVSVGKPADGE